MDSTLVNAHPITDTTGGVDSDFVGQLLQLVALGDNARGILLGLFVLFCGVCVVFVAIPVAKSVGSKVSDMIGKKEDENDKVLKVLESVEKGLAQLREQFGECSVRMDGKQDGIKERLNDSRSSVERIMDELLQVKEQIADIAYDIETIARQYTNVVSFDDAVEYATIVTDSLKNELVIVLVSSGNVTMPELWMKTQVREKYNEFVRNMTTIRFTGCPEGLADLQEWVQHHTDVTIEMFTDYHASHKDSISVADVVTLVHALVMSINADIRKKMEEHQ